VVAVAWLNFSQAFCFLRLFIRNFCIMNNIRAFVRNRLRELMNENYPVGAEQDSAAPWNQAEKMSTPIVAKKKDYTIIGLYPREIAILQDNVGKKYAFYLNSLDNSDLAPYAEREIKNGEHSDNWEVDSDIIGNYINDNAGMMSKGVGLDAWEKGVAIVEIDEALKSELLNLYGTNNSIQNALV
jgi:hypothetical protein